MNERIFKLFKKNVVLNAHKHQKAMKKRFWTSKKNDEKSGPKKKTIKKRSHIFLFFIKVCIYTFFSMARFTENQSKSIKTYQNPSEFIKIHQNLMKTGSPEV